MTDSIYSRIATATLAQDVGTLAALAMELAAEVASLSSLRDATEIRRAADAARKRDSRRGSTRMSEDVHGQDGTGEDGAGPLPPSPSSSFPTPHITPSSPPIPLPPLPPATDEERRLHERAPELWPVAVLFLEGKEPTARMAWIGRFHGALDRPPHPSGAELRDALEDLMTQPRDDWKPTLFRRYVERIRSDAKGASERMAVRSQPAGTSDAGTTFAKIRALIETVNIPGRGSRPVLPRAKVEALGPRVLAAYDAIGGAERFLDPDEKVGFVLRDFTKEYGTLTGAQV